MLRRLGPPRTEPGGNHEDSIERWCREWVRSPELIKLLELFGFSGASSADIEALGAFASQAWDFRRQSDGASVERNELEAGFDERTESAVLEAADILGLRQATYPTWDSYDHVLVLGGLIRACVTRPQFAAQMLDRGIQTRTVAGIGGFRPLKGDELDIGHRANLHGVMDETTAMDYGLRLAFGVDSIADQQGFYDPLSTERSWLVRRYVTDPGLDLMLVAAPSTEPDDRRANTADSYKFWAESVARLSPGDRVLLVTSAIYVPFQGLDAVRMLSLPYRCGIDVVGAPLDLTWDDVPRQEFRAVHFLQELNSAIRSIHAALQAAGRSL